MTGMASRLAWICWTLLLIVSGPEFALPAPADDEPDSGMASSLDWQPLPDLPDALGVAGPFVGVHNDALIVAGGANFPQPVWENDKQWHDRIYVLRKQGERFGWQQAGTLPCAIAYGAAVSTPQGVVCMGGNDAEQTFHDVFLLSWDAARKIVRRTDYPPLPEPCAYGQAALVGEVIYLAGGQRLTAWTRP